MATKLVCPQCSYGFEAADEDATYTCPNPECGHTWQSLTATLVTAFTVEGRRSRPELLFRSGERAGEVIVVEGPKLTLGRADGSDVRFTNLEVSRRHAEIVRVGDDCVVVDLDSRRGTFVNGRRVKRHTLRMGDEILFAGILAEFRVRFEAAGDAGALEVPAPAPDTDRSAPPVQVVRYRGRHVDRIPLDGERLSVGRQPDRDVSLEHPLISRRHAALIRDEEGWSVVDTKSRNGTFVNGRPVIQARLQRGDRVQFGPIRFLFDGSQLAWQSDWARATLEARGLGLRVGGPREGTTILEDVDIRVEPSELVGIIGPSGSGKTTLLGALSGFRRATAGVVALNGQPLQTEGGSFRPGMGYVPQDDIIHTELTARTALRYAGRLRLPRDTTAAELDQLVAETLDTLGLSERADLRISRLSGGQRKRVSLGVELLTRAHLIFMDEPTSGLDPGTEARMMRLFRRLADQGRTLVMTTHVMENIDAFDKVAVLSGGRLVYFGPPREMMAYFGIPRATDLYDRLDDRTPEEWSTLFDRSPERERSLAASDEAAAAGRSGERSAVDRRDGRARGPRRLDRFTQLRVLSHRYARILGGDWRNLGLMVLQPLIIFPAICAVFSHAGTILFLAALAMFWLGTTNAAREIVRERAIFLRERMVGVSVAPYVLSKVVVLFLVSVAQTAFAVVAIRYVEGVPGHALLYGAVLLLATLSGLALGLFISAASTTSEQATSVLPMVLIPQIVFGGFILAIDRMNAPSQWFSHAISTRWTYESLKYTFQERYYDVIQRDILIVAGFAALFVVLAAVWLRVRVRTSH